MTDAIADAERELEALGGHNHGPRADPFNPCIACAYMAAARKLALVVAEGASGQTCSCVVLSHNRQRFAKLGLMCLDCGGRVRE